MRRVRGFTLIELALAVGVMSVIIFSFIKLYQENYAQKAAYDIHKTAVAIEEGLHVWDQYFMELSNQAGVGRGRFFPLVQRAELCTTAILNALRNPSRMESYYSSLIRRPVDVPKVVLTMVPSYLNVDCRYRGRFRVVFSDGRSLGYDLYSIDRISIDLSRYSSQTRNEIAGILQNYGWRLIGTQLVYDLSRRGYYVFGVYNDEEEDVD